RAIFEFVAALKNGGLWTPIRQLLPLCGARTLSGALIPMKGVNPTNVGFVGPDYDRKTGLLGDATAKYLDLNVNNAADLQDDFHLATWVSTRQLSGFGAYAGAGLIDNGSSLLG